jgi:flagellar hook-associated protein 3 FlgL
MTRISTADLFSSALMGVQQARQAQEDAGAQVASGLKATDLKGFADQGATLQASQTVSARTQALLDNNSVLTERLGVQADALSSLSGAAQGAQAAVGSVLASGDGSTLVQTLQGWFSQASQSLNADYAGQPLFAGGTTDQPPLDTSDVTALAGAPTASHFHDGTLVRSDRIDESTVVQTGLTASAVGGPLVDAFKAIMDYNQPPTGPLTGELTNTQIDFLKSQLPAFSAATDTVTAAQTRTGVLQSQVSNATDLLNSRKTAVDALISNRTQADPAEAASRLQQAGIALQASAQVFSALSADPLLSATALQG